MKCSSTILSLSANNCKTAYRLTPSFAYYLFSECSCPRKPWRGFGVSSRSTNQNRSGGWMKYHFYVISYNSIWITQASFFGECITTNWRNRFQATSAERCFSKANKKPIVASRLPSVDIAAYILFKKRRIEHAWKSESRIEDGSDHVLEYYCICYTCTDHIFREQPG